MGGKTLFWHAPWLHGKAPKDIAPKNFESSTRKKWTVASSSRGCLDPEIKLEATFTSKHLAQFVDLWSLTNNVFLEDDIAWKITNNGQYSAASVYKL
jgi:hypothetical protein